VTGTAEPFRSGFVAFVGRPNAGKSTLVNALVGEKIAITSPVPQTTRSRLRGVVDRPGVQIVLVDTPGLHKPVDALGAGLNRAGLAALADVDVACLLVDASARVGRGDAWVAKRVESAKARKVLVMTKSDLTDPAAVSRQVEAARALMSFDSVAVVSSVADEGLDDLVTLLASLLPQGPRYFPEGMRTDQPLEAAIAEFIREKVLLNTRDEVPHAVGVMLEELSHEERSDLSLVSATVFVERESQKGILVGKGGEMVKTIGTEARRDLERLLGTRVHLDLRVKVKRDWRRDEGQVRRFGYGDGGRG